jgi:hypothetical protein
MKHIPLQYFVDEDIGHAKGGKRTKADQDSLSDAAIEDEDVCD